MSKSSRAAKRAAKAQEPTTEQVEGSTTITEVAAPAEAKVKLPAVSKRDWGPGSVIVLLRSTNPKKGKSAERYALYRDGMTVQEYTDAVVKAGYSKTFANGDLKWDSGPRHGFIRIETPAKS
jgi:hypothetical protein